MKNFLIFLISALAACQTLAQTSSNIIAVKTPKVVLDDFMDQRFGMFIHWGPVSLRGTEIGWSRSSDVPAEEYDNLYKEFNPTLFNADAWVSAAKNAGMKYLTITAKHHDGFCLWPTKVSNYNIMNSPYKKDIVGELAQACKKQGIKFCVYFTVLDWHDPDYGISDPSIKVAGPKGNMDKFVKTMKAELDEIVTKYDPYMLWFDGNWESPWKREYAIEIYNHLKKLKPNVVINNRLTPSTPDGTNTHKIMTPETIGDYATPEQKIGDLNMDDPWETCMTICKQWAWKPNDKMKTLKECIQTLVKTAGGNGNLLFNVGPMLDGRMEERQVKRLAEIGDWLKKYGESVYGTKGGPFKPNDDYAVTRKGNKLFVHVFNQQNTSLKLPALRDIKVKTAVLLKGENVKFEQGSDGAVTIHFPARLPDSNDSVIVLDMDSSAEQIPVASL